MRSPTDIWVYRHWEYELVVFAIVVVKMVHPDCFHVTRIDPTVAVGTVLDEHHRRKVIDVPRA